MDLIVCQIIAIIMINVTFRKLSFPNLCVSSISVIKLFLNVDKLKDLLFVLSSISR